MWMAAKARVEKPRLVQSCSLGSLIGYGGNKGEWSVVQKLRRIKNAGFEGFVGRVHMLTRDEAAESGLVFACTTDMGNGKTEPMRKLKRCKSYGARVVNVQMLDHDTLTPEAVTVARRVMATADELDLDVSIEVHRDTCTETPEKAYALAEGFEKAAKRPLKMTWDFSHPAVIKHLNPPFYKRLVERPDLVQFANQFHFRPFNGQHAQVPALGRGGTLTPEFIDWLEFAEQCLQLWLKAAPPGRELFICPEQIAGSYFLSVFGDRFTDTKAVRDEVGKAWKRQLKKWRVPRQQTA